MSGIPSHVAIKQAPDNGAGNGLFASQAVEPGTEILRIDQHLAAVLDSRHLKDACSNCYIWVPDNGVGQFGEEKGVGVKLRACQGCKVVRYCSKVGSLQFVGALSTHPFHLRPKVVKFAQWRSFGVERHLVESVGLVPMFFMFLISIYVVHVEPCWVSHPLFAGHPITHILSQYPTGLPG